MGIFNRNYDRPGPGIEKDAPPKKGIARFFEIYFCWFWELIKLNLLFLLCCIPVVTIGPACAAMNKITMMMVRDKPFFLVSDFFAAFRSNFKQGLVTGLLIGVISMLLGLSLWLYIGMMETNAAIVYIALILLASIAFSLGLTSISLYPVLVTYALSLKNCYKNAFLLGIACLKYTLPALVLLLALWLLTIYNFLFAIPLVLLQWFSLSALISCFAAWPGMKKYVGEEKTGVA